MTPAPAPVIAPGPVTVAEPPKPIAAKGAMVSIMAGLEKAAAEPAPAPEPTPEPPKEPAAQPTSKGLLDTPAEPAPEPPKPDKESKKAKDWAESKRLREEAEARAEAAEKRASELEAIAKEREQLLPLRDEVGKLKATIRGLSIEQDEDFRKTFIDGRAEELSQIKKLGEGLGVDAELMNKLSEEKDSTARLRMMKEANLEPIDMVSLRDAFNAVDALDKRRDAEVERWKKDESHTNYAEAKLLRDQEQQRDAVGKAFDALLPRIAERFPQFRENGDPAKNAQVQEDIKFARAIATGEASEEDQAAAPYLAVAARRLGIENSTLRAENKKLRDAVAAYEKGTPGVGGGSAADDHTPGDGKPVGAVERFKQLYPT